MSKPAVQKVTAAVSQRMRGSSEPRMAIQAAAGAIPRAKSQHQVRERREALGEGIEEDDAERDGARWKQSGFSARAAPAERPATRPPRIPRRSRARAVRRAGGASGCADCARRYGIHQAVERHGGGARAHHGDDDPGELSHSRSAREATLAQGQQRAGQRERQREDRVLELDHLQRQPEAFPHVIDWYLYFSVPDPDSPGTCYSFRTDTPRMLEAFALSDKGCVRTNNEDYCLIDPDRGLYVLADGMGGAKAGERASRMAVDAVAETVRTSPARDSQVLIRAAEEANRRVLEAAHSDPALEGMGTTLVAALESGYRAGHRECGRLPSLRNGRAGTQNDHRRPDLGQ